ncbi:protein of unknown function [Burkholderia multivorans]
MDCLPDVHKFPCTHCCFVILAGPGIKGNFWMVGSEFQADYLAGGNFRRCEKFDPGDHAVGCHDRKRDSYCQGKVI